MSLEVERARPAGYYDPPDEEDEHLDSGQWHPEEIEALFERLRSRLRHAAQHTSPDAVSSQGKRQADTKKGE